LTENAFTKTGNSFDGWATSSTGSVQYSNGESVKNLTSTDGEIFDLYAHWKEDAQTIETLNPVELDMNSTLHSLAGYRGTDINNSNPISGWAWGQAFTNGANYLDARYCAWGNVTKRFDNSSNLIASREITYSKGIGVTGSDAGTATLTTTAGLGGMCINTLTFGSSVRKLITSVEVCPYISCCMNGNQNWNSSRYGGLISNNWYWENSSSGLCFYSWGSSTYQGVYSRGQYYNVTMRLMKPDGTTTSIGKTVIDYNTKSDIGWASYSSASHVNHSLEFDFSHEILSANLPIGTYTTSLEFRQATSTANLNNSSSCAMAIHGSKFYCNS
jgi:uncharacterized repeat protein (TIGR02543 family)